MTFRLKRHEDDVIALVGDLSFNTVGNILQQTTSLFRQHTALRFDFSDVQRCDSAGIALLLEWLTLAKNACVELSFINFMPQMQKIIHVCGLSDMISRYQPEVSQSELKS